MRSELENPFGITKATEYTDNQILDYWVDLTLDEDQTIAGVLNPTEFLPKYVLGSKGCGKTHVLRYFSYSLQKIRHNGDINKILEDDKYIGIYTVLDGLTSSRFEGKGVNDEIWSSLFQYYFELYIVDKFLYVVDDIVNSICNDERKINQFAKTLCELFCEKIDNSSISNVQSFHSLISGLRKKIDIEILNAPFKRELDYESVKVLFSPGDLIFGIPKCIKESFYNFKDVKIIYILDEYEKLFDWQKVFVNTLVWEKKIPSTFWIGARKHGYTTRKTKTGEDLKPGSEFQPIELDVIIRKNDDMYKQFAKKLYVNRLIKYYETRKQLFSSEEVDKYFTSKFEKYEDKAVIYIILNKYKNKEFKHNKELNQKLKEALKNKYATGLKEEETDVLVKLLCENTDDNPLEQKLKLCLFYQKWAKAKRTDNLMDIALFVNKEYSLEKEGQASSFTNIREKYKEDLLAQLTTECNIKNLCYSGLNDFIDLSWGNPRVFLLILKLIIEKSQFLGEKPLEDGSKISLDAQFQGVYETARWFYNEAEIVGEVGRNLYKSINNLADLFRLYRFTDKITETSVSCFNFILEELSATAIDYIKLAETHSLIIEIESGRKGKNTGRKERMYQLNRTISPLWNLPSSRRGSASLNKELADAIFNPTCHSKFQPLYNYIKSRRMAPDFCKVYENDKKEFDSNPNLFTNI